MNHTVIITKQEINEAVAVKLGWKRRDGGFWNDPKKGRAWSDVPCYTDSMDAVWEVIEHVRQWPIDQQLLFVMAIKLQAPLLEGGDERDKLMWFLMESDVRTTICMAFLKHWDWSGK